MMPDDLCASEECAPYCHRPAIYHSRGTSFILFNHTEVILRVLVSEPISQRRAKIIEYYHDD